MKYNYLLLSVVFAFTSYAQNDKNVQSTEAIDVNGFPIQIRNVFNRDIQKKSILFSSHNYINARKLDELNTDSLGEGYPWISGDGLRLYYTSGNSGSFQIMFTKRPDTNSPFETPTVFPINLINPFSIWLSENELDAYVCTYSTSSPKIYYTQRSTTALAFSTFQQITLTGMTPTLLSSPSLNAAQDKLFLYANINSNSVMVKLNRTATNTFENLGLLAPNTVLFPGQLSKDELSFFVGGPGLQSGGTFKSLNEMTRVTTSAIFDEENIQEIEELNSDLYSSMQPSTSNNLNWIVFVRNNNNLWSGNDLCIANKQLLSMTNSEKKNSFSVSPNPSHGKLIFTFPASDQTPENYFLEIFDATGKIILGQQLSQELDLTNYCKGIYFAKISGLGVSKVEKIILY